MGDKESIKKRITEFKSEHSERNYAKTKCIQISCAQQNQFKCVTAPLLLRVPWQRLQTM